MDSDAFFDRRTPSSGSTLRSPNAPVHALRFIDQIDYYLWQASCDESAVLESIPSCFKTGPALNWYNNLVASKAPNKITVDSLRRALLEDFNVDAETKKVILSRYKSPDGTSTNHGYYQSQSFKLVMSYLDEVENMKEQLKYRNRKAVEDRREIDHLEAKWKKRYLNKEGKYLADIKEKDKKLYGLETKVSEMEETIKGLTVMLSKSPPITSHDIEVSCAKFQEELLGSYKRFKDNILKKSKAQAAELVNPRNSNSYENSAQKTMLQTPHWTFMEKLVTSPSSSSTCSDMCGNRPESGNISLIQSESSFEVVTIQSQSNSTSQENRSGIGPKDPNEHTVGTSLPNLELLPALEV
ncbi:hypothetical protein EDC01DRAFT_729600 [Geopyxis carbonaria]|nr:hypothetical protein EDC01DRAFT_729600 [Geopyxis carbonaria]